MKTIKLENLIDTKTGKTVEVEVPDDFKENKELFTYARNRGLNFATRIKAVADSDKEDNEMTTRNAPSENNNDN